MNHRRPMRLVVGTGVLELESLWQVEIQLDRGTLPETADRVSELYVDLGSVERASTGVDLERDPFTFQRSQQHAFRAVPDLIVAQPFSGTRRNFEIQLEAERLAYDPVDLVQAEENLILDLFHCTEDVRVIHQQTPHAQQPVKHPGTLVPIDISYFREAKR